MKFYSLRHRHHRVFKREDMSGLPHWTAARVLDPAGEAGAQPGKITVSRARERGGGITLE